MTGASDCRGVPVSYPVQSAIDQLDRAHEMALAFRGDSIAEIDKVIAEHPHFIMAHLFKAAWLTQAMETRIYGDMVKAAEDAEALIANGNDYILSGKWWISIFPGLVLVGLVLCINVVADRLRDHANPYLRGKD